MERVKNEPSTMYGDRRIGASAPALVVAEVGSNHNGNLQRATDLVGAAADAGADVVKFQALNLDKQYHPSAHDQDLRDLYQEIALPDDWYQPLLDVCNRAGVGFLCSPTYDEAVDRLADLGVPAFKIASAQTAGDRTLVKRAARTGQTIILSTGLTDLTDLLRTIDVVRSTGNPRIAVLYCVSRYPTDPEELNLERIPYLREILDVPVGLSDHTVSTVLPAASVSKGAAIIEKHITLDRELEGPDHHFSLEPNEFSEMVDNIRTVEKAVDPPQETVDGEKERGFLAEVQVKMVAPTNLAEGETVEPENVDRLRAPQGIPVETARTLGELRLTRPKKKGEVIGWDDVAVIEPVVEGGDTPG